MTRPSKTSLIGRWRYVGEHRLITARPQPGFWTHPIDNPRRRIYATLGLTVGGLGTVITLAWAGVSVPDTAAAATPETAALVVHPKPLATLIVPPPHPVDQRQAVRFFSALTDSGIKVDGRADALIEIARRGAAADSTNTDLAKAARALFPDLTAGQAESFASAVRLYFADGTEGHRDNDADGDGDGK